MQSGMLRRRHEPLGCFLMIDAPIPSNERTARLPFDRAERLRRRFGVVQAAALVVKRLIRAAHGLRRMRLVGSDGLRRKMVVHALAPFRICAIWMNLSGTPIRSAEP